MKIENSKKHITALEAEVAVLKSRLEPHDTGHLHTTINVLKERIEELSKSLKKEKKMNQTKKEVLLMHLKINAESPYNDGWTQEGYRKEYERLSKKMKKNRKN